MTKIVVVTPVKNDAWILDRFLSVTSYFADHIIITDQLSTDGSREIYKKYPKVIVLDNTSEEYNEAARQIQLIKKAREIVPGKRVILTLDADEILVANYLETKSWAEILEAPVGTVLYFKKPDLQGSTSKAIRYAKAEYPMGIVEDYSLDSNTYYLLRGFTSKGHKILDRKVELDLLKLSQFRSLQLEDDLFLHYAQTRLDIQSSKMRLYSVIETTLYGRSLRNILIRRHKYKPNPDYSKLGKIESSDNKWFEGWEMKGIDMHSVEKQEGLYWRDLEVLKLFKQYGYKYFKYEDIWDVNWEGLRLEAMKENFDNVPISKIQRPNFFLQYFFKLIYCIYSFIIDVKNRVFYVNN